MRVLCCCKPSHQVCENHPTIYAGMEVARLRKWHVKCRSTSSGRREDKHESPSDAKKKKPFVGPVEFLSESAEVKSVVNPQTKNPKSKSR